MAGNKEIYGISIYSVLYLVLLGHVTSAMQVLLTFREPSANKLQNMVIDRVNDNVFIGATNKLLKLSSDLTLLESASVGPREDNPNCPPPPSVCFENKTSTNSYSKGLAIDYENSAIISCSTLFHGFCQKRPLDNIEKGGQDFYELLVSNDPMTNSIIFVASGLDRKDALYIGSTYTIIGSTVYRDSVPSISSRKLGNLKFSHKDTNGGTLISVLPKYRSEFLVEFIHGFSFGNFVYFITTHKNSMTSAILETTIVRLCTTDKYFQSYVEIPVRCHSNRVEYGVAKTAHFDANSGKLVIAFAQMQENSDELSGSSALCSYQMADVERDFNLTVEECYKGSGKLGPAHIHKPQTCIHTSATPDMCASSVEAEAYSAIEGQTTISSSPLIAFPQSVISAIALTQSGNHMIILLGTLEGNLKKVIVSPERLVTVVDDIDIDNRQPVNKEMYFDKAQKNLYVLTPTKLSKVSAKHCEEKTTCEDCTVSGDPLCGWCVMENECRLKSDCPLAVITPHWLPSRDRTCAAITDMSPDILSFENLENSNHGQQITFTMKEVSLSVPNVDINCYFVSPNSQTRTAAIIQDKSVSCPVPERSQLPRLPVDHHSVELQFHVQGHAILKRSVELYDCRVHQNCTSCAGSTFGCQWCYASHSCISGNTNSCTGQATAGITNSNSCPRIESPSRDTDIVVHSGEQKRIVFRVINPQAGQTDNIKCQFEYFKKSQIVNGTVDSANNLICDTVEFSFDDNESPYVTAAFAVTWGNDGMSLDNPRGIKVRIYKCPLMVTNCGKCLSMDSEYECGWCDTSCTLQKHCSGTWLDRSSTCPNPFILRFSPTNGPIQGKTNISVTGINLGKAYTDITVTVAGVTCVLHPTHYEPSSRFICETEFSEKEKSGSIKVVVDGNFTAISDSLFTFITPEVSSIHPMEGPTSGGTMVTILGTGLNTGSSITVDIGGSNCEVTRLNSTVIQCLTSRQTDSLESSEVEVNFGGFRRLLTEKFTYQEDPVITMIEPKKTILSGGTKITVMGTMLKLIQNPEFFVEVGDRNITTACVHSNTMFLWLLCQTPRLSPANENVTDTNPKEVHFGFNLDGVTTWRNISRDPSFGPILYYPDPVIDHFEGEKSTKKFVKDDVLVIQGKFRSVSPLMTDVIVMVGSEKCKNPAATDTAITCDAPVKPGAIDEKGNALVQIKIGNLQSDVGYLNYYEVEEIGKPIAMGIILGVVLPILAIIILLTICVIRRHRKHGPSENYIPDVLKDYEGRKEEEDIGMNHVSTVKADMNGQIPDDKDSPYIAELLENIQDESARQKVSEILIPRSKLVIGELIAKGNFGPTYKANYNQSESKTTATAVKCLQSTNTDRSIVEGFLQRCAVMHDIQHPNVLPVMGVCLTASNDPLIVLPYSEHGDIKTYIREPSKNVTVLELLEMAQQIAEGMAYLEGLNIIHRNLSARNCLICEERNVKVADFGITKDLFSKEYYFSDDSRSKLLTKWLAPETLENFDFSTKTDVWSYGILLWELLTRGVTPYPDVEAKDLKEYIKNGNRMKKPRQCPENIYQLMLRCWAYNPDERPTFREISDEIQKYVQTDAQEDVDAAAAEPLKTSIKFSNSTEFIHSDS